MSRRRRSLVLALGVVLVLSAAVPLATAATVKPPVLAAACRRTLVASSPGAIASSSLTETSGLAAGRRTRGVWWAHNDSGDSARVFALGNDGRDLGEYVLDGAAAVDWEDIAIGPGPSPRVPYLYLADIGDNDSARTSVQVYRVPEPRVDTAAPAAAPQTLTGVETLTFTYPDGPRDAEGFFVDPTTGELFVVSKDLLRGVARVYRAPADLPSGSTTELTQVATVSLGVGQGVTGADMTARGGVIALRTYLRVVLFGRASGQPVGEALAQTSCRGATAFERQGEAIGFTRNGRGYVTVSEGDHPALHRFVAP